MEVLRSSIRQQYNQAIEEVTRFCNYEVSERQSMFSYPLCNMLLKMLQLDLPFGLHSYSNSKQQQIFRHLIFIQIKELAEGQKIQISKNSDVFFLLEGKIRIQGQKIKQLNKRSSILEQKIINHFDKTVLLTSIQNYVIYSLGNSKLLQIKRQKYNNLVDAVKRIESQQIISFFVKYLKIHEDYLRQVNIVKKIQICNLSSHASKNISQNDFYLIKSGQIQLQYLQNHRSVLLTEGSIIAKQQSLKTKLAITAHRCSLLFYLSQGLVKQLNKKCFEFSELLKREEKLHNFRIISYSQLQKTDLQAKEETFTYSNVRINSRSKRKRFRVKSCENENQNNFQNAQFINFLPYQKLIEGYNSLQNFGLKNKYEYKKKYDKIMTYLKKSQTKSKNQKYLELKMKSIAQKTFESTNSKPNLKMLRQKKESGMKWSIFSTMNNYGQQTTESTKQLFLSKDDTGLINSFIKNSHNYQKQISYLLETNQKESKHHQNVQGNFYGEKKLNEMIKKIEDFKLKDEKQGEDGSYLRYFNKSIEDSNNTIKPQTNNQNLFVHKRVLKRAKSGKIIRSKM